LNSTRGTVDRLDSILFPFEPAGEVCKVYTQVGTDNYLARRGLRQELRRLLEIAHGAQSKQLPTIYETVHASSTIKTDYETNDETGEANGELQLVLGLERCGRIRERLCRYNCGTSVGFHQGLAANANQ